MTEKDYDIAWHKWSSENLQRGCDNDEIAEILKNNNFSEIAIKRMMGEKLPDSSRGQDTDKLSNQIYAKLAEIPKRDGLQSIDTDQLQICRIENFMSDSECDEMIKIVNSKLRPSEISVKDPDKYFRTSSTCDLLFNSFPLVDEINKRISSIMGINEGYGEPLQGQKYIVGQQFKAHTDYFEPNSEEYKKFCSQLGNRTWTFMIYLNNVEEGGHTDFPQIGESFKPTKGNAVAWNNLDRHGTPNYNSLHSGNPIISGEKIVLTKWFREKSLGRAGEMII